MLIEGFDPARPTEGTQNGPCTCHTGALVQSWWEHAIDGTQTVSWESMVVPAECAGRELTLSLACGFGTGDGQGTPHALTVNGRLAIRFGAPSEANSVWEAEGIRIEFHALAAVPSLLGIMRITLSAEMLEYGSPVRFKVTGETEGVRSIFMLQSVEDTAAISLAQEQARRDIDRAFAARARRKDLRDFQNQEIGPMDERGFVFGIGGPFPDIGWKAPGRIEELAGRIQLHTRWFNRDLQEVAAPSAPGRYMAYAEGDTPSGTRVRRALTFYCRPEGWQPWQDAPRVRVDWPANSPFHREAWDERREEIGRTAASQFADSLTSGEKGAIFSSWLAEIRPTGMKPDPLDTATIANDDLHVALRRKIMGIPEAPRPLRPPGTADRPSPVLRRGTEPEAGFRRGAARRIRALCREWAKVGEEPFAVLVARNGVVILHEMFHPMGRDRLPLDTPFGLASVTKNMTGLLFAQFMEQGLAQPDDPVGRYLPDFPSSGPLAVTLRQCFVHTTGLEGHYEWSGIHNPWLDNVVANGLEYLHPGKTFLYTGMGYDLAGKVMESIAGKSVIRLMHECLFRPLGMAHARMDDLACETECSVEDLARIAQLCANKGSYGDRVFFSPKVFEQLLPKPIDLFPDMPIIRGIGCVRVDVPDPGAGENGVPADRLLFGTNTLCGIGAGGRFFLVDMDTGTIVVQVRHAVGKEYGRYSMDLYRAVDGSIVR